MDQYTIVRRGGAIDVGGAGIDVRTILRLATPSICLEEAEEGARKGWKLRDPPKKRSRG